MATATTPTGPPAALAALSERFDAEVVDLPGGRARVRLQVGEEAWDATIRPTGMRLGPARADREPDALLSAEPRVWRAIARDLPSGMEHFRGGRLSIRRSLHLGVGFLAATSGNTEPERLRFESVQTRSGRISTVEAGAGDAVVCLHGLGGTKASFLPTVAALADEFRVIAIDLPGFGESDKPIGARYDAPYFARVVSQVLDELGLERAHLIGNSMGGRVALEVGMLHHERTAGLVLLSPALAFLSDRRWAPALRLLRPELGLLQIAPRPIVERLVRSIIPGAMEGWAAAAVDEFLRAYLTPRGRAAFYAAARNIYLDEPHGRDGFWTRLAELSPESMFVWGRQDQLVPIGFMRHVERTLPAARHVELDCGHVPQVELPRQTHAAIRGFLRDS